MAVHEVTLDIGGKTLTIETGRMARLAAGAAVIRLGDTMVISGASVGPAREGGDFFPLTIDYREKTYAAGKIPGGFLKRESAPSPKEILAMRMADRPIRPLWPDGFMDDVQVQSFVISYDQVNEPDVLSVIGASAALSLSPLPFQGPLAAVRIGMRGDEFVAFPDVEAMKSSPLDLIVAGTKTAVTMVEAGAAELSEDVMLEAIYFGHEIIARICDAIEELRRKSGWRAAAFTPKATTHEAALEAVRSRFASAIKQALFSPNKLERQVAVGKVKETIKAALVDANPVPAPGKFGKADVATAIHEVERDVIRNAALDGKRVDGRATNEIRPITIEIGLLPRAHGSALFTRGETQALVAATLGTKSDEQKIEALEGESYRHFMLHYNFPSFSVGEVRRFGSPSRRDIGHGALAERAVEAVLPAKEEFPYTIRVVSDILESNGSSSMATVCGASLALMDAGVPLKSHVAGIAMGLVKEGDRFGILTDIMGTEDHYGDMDFKVAGTEKGVTALQMDIKIAGVSIEIMREALAKARDARMVVLGKMRDTLDKPRAELSPYAPRFVTIKIRTEKIREIIGPGGKVIRGIQEQTGTKIDVEDDGRVTIFSPDAESVQKALSIVQDICREVELDRIYLGKVKKIVEFGAFVEVIPNTEGLLHISQIAESRIRSVQDVLTEGDEVLVKVIEIDGNGKMRLSRKMALRDQPALADKERLKNPQAANPPRA
jgi:polyribonucleotide nucleotidyltransferase